ncbi:WD40 repeat-like protein [Viridothelium virens]|uniref:WD40 repeat-like protein n=1 Tax=Viridothelium virens TaxID=1048519 RepID=A0A6A6HRL5_VIRVR|nr:WD40 repeat-like protein [Viridothelium virens]
MPKFSDASNSPQRELANPPTDAISSIKFSPHSDSRLLVASWDKHVYLYDTSQDDENQLIKKFEHRAPVLDVCFGKDDNEAFSGGLDMDVRKIDLTTGEQTVLSTHDKAVKALVYSTQHSMLISGSWDSSIHIHHPDNKPDYPSTLPLPSKVYSLSLAPTRLVISMASRALYIYDLYSLNTLAASAESEPPNTLNAEPWQRRESALKHLTRTTACMPSDEGYATSSIEGRIAVDWFDSSEESQARKYAFKCHRQNGGKDPETGEEIDVVYPVNALAFHPTLGSMASGGGDGQVLLWDPLSKRRTKAYAPLPASVAAVEFNRAGNLLAIAISSGFEDGKVDMVEGSARVFVRELAENEAKLKKK